MKVEVAGGIGLIVLGALLILLLLPGIPETVSAILKIQLPIEKWHRSTRIALLVFGIGFMAYGISTTQKLLQTPPNSPSPVAGTLVNQPSAEDGIRITVQNPTNTDLYFVVTDENDNVLINVAVLPNSDADFKLSPGKYEYKLDKSPNKVIARRLDILPVDYGLIVPITDLSQPPTAVLATNTPQLSTNLPSTQQFEWQDPRDFLRWYFTALWQTRDYSYLWTLATPSFRAAAIPGGSQEFASWWNSVAQTDVNDATILQQTATTATVEVDLTFHLKDGRTLSNRVYEYDLSYSRENKTWMLDYR